MQLLKMDFIKDSWVQFWWLPNFIKAKIGFKNEITKTFKKLFEI